MTVPQPTAPLGAVSIFNCSSSRAAMSIRIRLVSLSALTLLLAIASSPADDIPDNLMLDPFPHPKGYVCYRAPSPIAIDGKLTESAWEAAPWTDEFVDIEGDKKPKPRYRTRVK